MNCDRKLLWSLFLFLFVAACGDASVEWRLTTTTHRFAWDWNGFHLAFTTEWDGSADLWVLAGDETLCERLAAHTTGQFAWSPDGARVAYGSRDIFNGSISLATVRVDGTERRFLSTGWSRIGLPLWSPGGLRLAFTTTDVLGRAGLHSVRPDGTGLSHILTGSVLTDVAWSPDGQRIACRVSAEAPGAFELQSALADGTLRRVASGGGSVRDGGIAWSGDGARLLYRADEDVPGAVALYSVRPDGTERRRLSGDLGRTVLSGFACAPDAPYVAYRTRGANGAVELWMARDGFDPQLVTGELAEDLLHASFAWSPDGEWIAFRTAAGRLSMFAPASGAQVEIDAGVAPGFDWSPDGTRLAYLSAGVLHTASAGAGTEAAIGECDGAFAWSPDGTSILFVSGGLHLARMSDGLVFLVSSIEVIGAPAWSPGGNRIVFRGRGAGGTVEFFLAWPHGGAVPIDCHDPVVE